MLSPVECLAIITRRLEATNNDGVPVVGRKSAQVIPFGWSTLSAHDTDYVVGIPVCSCPWLDTMSQFCGLFLFHREQTSCPTCAQLIHHVLESVPYIVRLGKVALRLEPIRDLVAYTRRSRRVVSTTEAVQICIGKQASVYKTVFDKYTKQEQHVLSMVIARVIIVVSNVCLTVRSPRRADVIYSDGIDYNGTDTYTCTTSTEPVIFSIAGAGTVLHLVPLHGTPMLIYEVTAVAEVGTTLIRPAGIVLYPEVRSLPKPVPCITATPALTPSLLHSSHSFIQPHRLRIRIEKRALVITIEHDPVLVFFNRAKALLHVYTGTSVYVLRVFLNRTAWRPECYCMRETGHVIDNAHVTLNHMIQRYGALVSTLPIETLLFIHGDRETVPDFQWTSIPMSL